MQRLLFFTLLMAICQLATAQNPYSKFVEKSSVKWAAYAHDTFRFSKLNLNLYLRDQLTNNKIEAKLTDYNNNTEISVSIDSVKERIAPSKIVRVVNDNGKLHEEELVTNDQLYNSTYFNEFTQNLVNVQQVIYLEDGRLQSHIPWVSPMYNVVTTMGTELGMSNAFETAFNKDKDVKNRWKRKAIYLGNTSKKFELNAVNAGLPLLKPMYGNNLLQAIWPYLNNQNYQLMNPSSNAVITQKDVTMYLLDSTKIDVPVYNENGEVSYYQKIDLSNNAIQLDSIPFVILEQEWFYLPTQNKLYNHIISIECWGKKTTAGMLDEKPSPFLKIIQAK